MCKNKELKKFLLLHCAKTLTDFGYKDVKWNEIITDKLYHQFAEKMFKDLRRNTKKAGKDLTVVDEVLMEIQEYKIWLKKKESTSTKK